MAGQCASHSMYDINHHTTFFLVVIRPISLHALALSVPAVGVVGGAHVPHLTRLSTPDFGPLINNSRTWILVMQLIRTDALT